MFKLTRGIESPQGLAYYCPECGELVTWKHGEYPNPVAKNFQFRALLDQCGKNHDVQVVVYWDILE